MDSSPPPTEAVALRYGDRVYTKLVPEAVGTVCENPLGSFGVLPATMVWVRWPSGVAYSWVIEGLTRVEVEVT